MGRLAEADGGTLFLDEIGDMPLDAQTRLLRVFDGADPVINPKTGRKPNARVIAATNRDLRALVSQGLFREDLYFRLNVAPIRVPPLRERTEDIPELARAFLLRASREGLPSKTIDQPALDRLKLHDWPGNVRELENLIRRICALYGEETIGARIIQRELANHAPARASDEPVTLSSLVESNLASYFAGQPGGIPPVGLYDRVLADVERPLFQLTLAATRGNQMRAAEVLGLNRNTLRKRLSDLGIDRAKPTR
jgi:two-component system nitrogen regulation response regulator GlnG